MWCVCLCTSEYVVSNILLVQSTQRGGAASRALSRNSSALFRAYNQRNLRKNSVPIQREHHWGFRSLRPMAPLNAPQLMSLKEVNFTWLYLYVNVYTNIQITLRDTEKNNAINNKWSTTTSAVIFQRNIGSRDFTYMFVALLACTCKAGCIASWASWVNLTCLVSVEYCTVFLDSWLHVHTQWHTLYVQSNITYSKVSRFEDQVNSNLRN